MRARTALVVVVTLGLIAGQTMAQGLKPGSGNRNRDALFSQQKKLLDTRLSRQYENSARLTPKGRKPGLTTSASNMIPRYAGRYQGEWVARARAAAKKHGIPEDLFLRLVQQESGFNTAAVSTKGALGLAQLMPGTAAGLGVDPLDPQQNLDGGARYLKQMYARFGNWRHALAAYNAGPEAVVKHNGIPPFKETQGYVVAILGP